MAAIDKIYGSKGQWIELDKFLRKHKKHEWLKYLRTMPNNDSFDNPISNFPREVDMWLMDNCPLDFVQERLKEQYGKW